METSICEIGGRAASQLEACARPGLCAAACPFYGAIGDPEHAPLPALGS